MDVSNFTREDVQRHLLDLGYTNISEEKMDLFIKDLRKLIIYEEREKTVSGTLDMMEGQKTTQKFDQSLPRSRTPKEIDSSTSPDQMTRPRRRVRRKDKKAKSAELEDHYITTKTLPDVERDSVDYEAGASSLVSETQSSLYIDVDLPEESSSHCDSNPTLAASLMDTRQAPSFVSGPGGFIRVRSGPSVGTKPPASDPVALHQQYRKHWAKVNIPGEKSHNKLRWAVRGWMMGEEPL